MAELSAIPGLAALWARTTGDDRIRVAVVDGAVDNSHPALAGVALTTARSLWPADATPGARGAHGTAVAGVLAGRHGGPAPGVAPGCRIISVPVFSDRRPRTTQLDLARGIEAAVEAGAHVVNVSAGRLSAAGGADDLLARAVRRCAERGVLVVAAAGNDGCFCAHVPAALPSVLAVGALADSGKPLAVSNWGAEYQRRGLLAPGENLLCPLPGGGVARRTGTSLATPLVAGVAALLLSLQVAAGRRPDPRRIADALLTTATPCGSDDPVACLRLLTGTLDIERAVNLVTTQIEEEQVPAEPEVAQSCACSDVTPAPEPVVTQQVVHRYEPAPDREEVVPSAVEPEPEPSSLVYAIGALGYDFGTEARRDSFKQALAAYQNSQPMPADAQPKPPPNPYDAKQLVTYLRKKPSESNRLIWTLNLELTPVYAIEGVGGFGPEVYQRLVDLLDGQVAATTTTESEVDDAAEADRRLKRVRKFQKDPRDLANLKKLIQDAGESEFKNIAEDAFHQADNALHHAKWMCITARKYAKPDDPRLKTALDAKKAADEAWKKAPEFGKPTKDKNKLIEQAESLAESAKKALECAEAAHPIISGERTKRFIERVALPGRVTGRTVRLFSGQVVPVIELEQTEGLVGWDVKQLAAAAVDADDDVDLRHEQDDNRPQSEEVREALRDFLNRIYFELRNLGKAAADRALNYAATNAFQAGQTFAQATKQKLVLDEFGVEKSPYARPDSDSWDIKLSFFNPLDTRRARLVFRYTVDVSDVFPVTVGAVRSWRES
ncbi:S8 family serine peptidase [Amycolatopsis sp. NPDC051071]|uniref:cyanobactin maturation protease PatG family protein n=1 Tax=Amycolatopsis sp. NPDC051071 TaxID=3154637 RepID=UPI003412B2A8